MVKRTQGYNARAAESVGMRDRTTTHRRGVVGKRQTLADRVREMKAEDRALARRAYAAVKTMDLTTRNRRRAVAPVKHKARRVGANHRAVLANRRVASHVRR